ncbi:hypothetical protein F2Q68_00045855 [Brassica cretica]|uniref:Uncharacterized protein n=1 Tax=Brassica cretica TaxID=69181 RepID=A0A8S9LQ04_BRACR|nr:hypothetical protein F2Q68_00045855 [Brassica cretica]
MLVGISFRVFDFSIKQIDHGTTQDYDGRTAGGSTPYVRNVNHKPSGGVADSSPKRPYHRSPGSTCSTRSSGRSTRSTASPS